MRIVAVLALAVAAVAVLWVLNCSGPQAEVRAVRLLEPEKPGDPYRVEATVHNDGPGEGQVGLIFKLHTHATGEVFQVEETAHVNSEETLTVTAEIPAPPGEYRPEVEVEYPVK